MLQANLSEPKLKILEKLDKLSQDYQELVLDFVEMLSQKQQEKQINQNKFSEVDSNNEDLEKNFGYGSLKGKIWMSEDFDEPLEDLEEYM